MEKNNFLLFSLKMAYRIYNHDHVNTQIVTSVLKYIMTKHPTNPLNILNTSIDHREVLFFSKGVWASWFVDELCWNLSFSKLKYCIQAW